MLSAVVPLLISFPISVYGGGHSGATVAPLYQIDLRSVVKGPFLFEPWGSPESRSGLPIRSLCFLDNQQIAVTVVTQAGGKPGLATRIEPNSSSPFRLYAILIGASSGRILASPDWPSNSRFAGIVAANDKGFVTESGRDLTLFSTDLTPGKRISLPSLPPNQYTAERYWNPRPSWSGRRVLFLGQVFWIKGPWLWLDAETLQVLDSWQETLTGAVAVSDDHIAMGTGARHFGDPPPFLKVGIPGADWRPIPSTLNAAAPQFVGPDVLYFHRYTSMNMPGPPRVFLMHSDGSEIFNLGPVRKGWGLGKAAVSRVGNRFVILEGETKGSVPMLDIGGHEVLRALLIYDPPFSSPSRSLVVRNSKSRNMDAVALSPDGRHLAICSYPEPVVEVFELPPAN